MVTSPSQTQDFLEKAGMPKSKELRDCFYCHKPGHLIADCPVLMRKQQSKNPKSVALMKTVLPSELSCCTDVCDINYKLLLYQGLFPYLERKRIGEKSAFSEIRGLCSQLCCLICYRSLMNHIVAQMC